MVCICRVLLCLIVWGNAMPFSTKDIPSYIPTGNVQRFQFLHVLAIMAGFLISRSWLCPQRRGQCPAHSSVQFSRSVVSDSLQPRGLQHTRLPCPSPTPRACSNSCPLSQWYHPTISSLSFPSPASMFPSIMVFSNELVLRIRWPKYWSFSFSISPSNEYSGLISFRMDWLYLLAVQGTLKSLLQHHSSQASILRLSAFFMVQLSHPYMITGKTIALTRRTFVGKVMSLPLNMLSRLVIAFLPRSKCLLISWLQSPSAVVLEPKK